jgi:hypothetical protein
MKCLLSFSPFIAKHYFNHLVDEVSVFGKDKDVIIHVIEATSVG